MKVRTCALRGRSDGEWHTSVHYQRLEIGGHISNAVSTALKDFLIMIEYEVIVKGLLDIPWKYESVLRVYSVEGISPTITTAQGGGIVPKILIRHDEE